MAIGTIAIGSTTLYTPSGYVHEPIKRETYERTIDGTLLINRAVTAEDQPVSKYHFEVSDIENSAMDAIKEEAAHISNLYYIDYFPIMEVLSGDGTTKTFYLQRESTGTTDMTIEVNGVEITIDSGVAVTINDSGRCKMVFDAAPTDVDDNIVVKYVPKYAVHIMSYRHEYRIADVAYYSLICEEV